MTPAQLAVEADALLQGGRTPEEVATMQLLSDPEWVRLLRAWSEGSDTQPWTDHACVECVPRYWLVPFARPGWLCLWHRAKALPGPREFDDPEAPEPGALPGDAGTHAGRPRRAGAVERALAEAEDTQARGRVPADFAADVADDVATEAPGAGRELGVAGADREE